MGRHEEDAGIVDHRVHPADVVHLVRNRPGLGRAGEVADDDSRPPAGPVGERRGALPGPGMQDNVMALIHERGRGRAAEPVNGARDEDARHGTILPRRPPHQRRVGR
jgi:hypothetical protein